MKKNIFKIFAGIALVLGSTFCTNLDEHVYNMVDKSVFYQDENSVKAAVASVYYEAAENYAEYFYYLQEFSADQMSWRIWNDTWGYDEGEKYVLSVHKWNAESKIINTTWSKSWTTIGLCNNIIFDLQSIDPSSIGMTSEKVNSYIAEVRTMRAWAYYNIFELWGGALPLCNTVSADIPASESRVQGSFEAGCKSIYNFIADELDAVVDELPQNNVNRMSQAANRILRARLALNANVLIGEEHFSEAGDIAQKIINGDYGSYSIVSDYRDIYSIGNRECPEIIFAFACEKGQSSGSALNMRNVTGFPYNFKDILGVPSSDASGWNCVIVAPSHDNSGTIQPQGGTDTGGRCFLDAPYNDKLGAVYERFDDRDIRKAPFTCDDSGNWSGHFLMGYQYARGTQDIVPADADREGQDLCYVDQLATFQNASSVQDVMSPYYGETNSGYRLVKYPVYPDTYGVDYRNIDEVEFRLAEAYYILAEVKLRGGDSAGAKSLVDQVRGRYFRSGDRSSALQSAGPGFGTTFDLDWMLSEWGKEFLSEGRRRRTDLRRFDKFTNGQWWFMGRGNDVDGTLIPAKRDSKYEWFPLPASAFQTNAGLEQTPGY